MLEVKITQHLRCGKRRFPQDFHRFPVENFNSKFLIKF